MNSKKIILFLIICIIGVSMVSATDDNTTFEDKNNFIDDSTSNDIIENYNIESNTNTNNIQNTESIEKKDKSIKKDSNPKTIILNSTTFHEYITNERFNDKVNNGDTIDIQGILDGNFTIKINKALNIISSTHDGFINIERYSESFGGTFNEFDILTEGSGTNISDIRLHNAHILLINTHNITINNLTASCDMSVGMGSGMISIREGSSHVTITNSYFETSSNGGHSNVVYCFARDCLFENNTVIGHGNVGNILYLTTYGGVDASGEINETYGNINITVRNNIIDGMDVDPQSPICVGLVYEGANHTFENNSILRGSRTTMIQHNDYGTNVYNITFENNYIPFTGRDYITDNNFNSYGTLDSEGVYTLANDTSNKAFIINATNISTVINNYGSRIYALSSNIQTYITNYIDNETYKIDNLYAPNTTVIINRPLNITNSIVKQLKVNTSANITNNIIINQLNNTIISNNQINSTVIKDNYLLSYNKKNITYGDDTISFKNGTVINNGPNLNGVHHLTNENYNELFNENYTLKEGINGTIIALDNLTNPVIINKAVILKTAPNINTNFSIVNRLHGHPGKNPVEDFLGRYIYCHTYDAQYYTINGPIYSYSNITFVNGSEKSNVTNIIAQNIQINTNNITIENSSLYGKITTNNSNNSNLINNVLFGNNSSINIINSNNNRLKKNIINNNEEYTIIVDETSTNNIITDNDLITDTSKGDFSIHYTNSNTVKDNLPLTEVNISIKTNSTRVMYITNSSNSNQQLEYDVISPGKTYEIRANVTSNEGVTPKGHVLILFNGTQIGKYELENGTATTNMTVTDLNQGYLRAWYLPEDNLYEMTSTTKFIKNMRLNTNTTITANTTKIGEKITVYATVMDEYNEAVPHGTLKFIVNNVEYNSTITNGTATFTAITNESWNNGIRAKYYQSAGYNESTSNIIKLEKGDVLFYIKQKIEGENLKISVNVTDIGNIPVSTGYVRFKINKTTNVPINNGNAEYEIALANITEGQEMSITFTSNPAFNTKTENITLSLDPPTITQIQIEDIVGKINQPTVITATVTAEDGITVNEGSVTFTTTDYTETVNIIEGVAQTTHTFTQSLIDTLQAIYIPITSNYYECTNTCTIIISKDPENVTINLNAITGRINEEVTLTATVMTTDNMQVSYGSVTFTTINFNETVNIIDGTATTTHIFTDEMDELLTATFIPANPDDYNPSSNTTTITIKGIEYSLKVDTTTFTLLEPNNITASIYYGDNLARNISKGKVTFKVNGKTLKDSNGKVIYVKIVNGTATIENYMISDTWNKQTTIQAVYSGSVDVESLKSEKENITITKAAPTITLSDVTATQGQSIEINMQVTLLQNPVNTGKLIIKINGKTIKDANGKVIFATVTNGMATILYTIPESMKAKDYPLTAIFTSTDYERAEATKTLTVLRN